MNKKLQEALRRNRQRSQSNFLPIYKFPDGHTDIRILPASKQDDKDDWFIPVGQHFNLEDKFGVFCPYETFWANDDCPVCETVKSLRQDGLNDEANKLSVRRSYYARAVIRGEEEKGIQIVRLPSTLFTQIGEIIAQEDVFGDVLHPGKGRDIRVKKSGTGLGTSYSAVPMPKTSLIMADVQATKKILEGLDKIETLVDVPTAEHLTKLLEDKIGFSALSPSATLGDTFSDEDMFDADESSPISVSEDDGFNFDDDDEEEEEDDVPFEAEEEDGDDSVSSEDISEDDDDEEGDSWLEDDGEEEEEIMDVSEIIASRRKPAGDTDLTEDLAEHLESDGGKTKRRGKSRKVS